MKDFIKGFKYALSGFRLILKPGVRLFVLIPLLINTVLFAAVISYGFNAMDQLIDSYLTGRWWEWLSWLLWPLFFIIVLTVVFFCFSILANLIASPFNGFLAEAAETQLTGRAVTESVGLKKLPAEIKRAILAESRKVLYLLIRTLPLLLLFFIPLFNLAAPFLWFLFGAWMLALEYLDFTAGNHGVLFPELRNRLASQRPLAFGYGVGVMFLTIIPVINFIAIPLAVCGGTRLWVDRLQHQQAIAPPG